MFFVGEVDEAVAWYRDGLDGRVDGSGLAMVVVGAVHLGFHPAEEKTRSASAAPFRTGVDSLAAAIERFPSAGAELHRGPLAVEDGRSICQLRDRFGNVLGLVGPDRIGRLRQGGRDM